MLNKTMARINSIFFEVLIPQPGLYWVIAGGRKGSIFNTCAVSHRSCLLGMPGVKFEYGLYKVGLIGLLRTVALTPFHYSSIYKK